MSSRTTSSSRRGPADGPGLRRRGSRGSVRAAPGPALGPPLLAILLGLAALAGPARAQESEGRGSGGADYPYVPTPPGVVSHMLELADVSGRDTVYDLGSGDGRIVVTAARRYGAPGVGVELDSSLVAESRRKAASEGVEDRVRFVRGDLFDTDLSPATVVALYLLPGTMDKLEPVLFRQLRPGARIVSHDFDMDGWAADSVVRTPGGLGGHATLHLWRVPALVGGTWEVTASGLGTFRVRLDQRFQELRARTPDPSAPRVVAASVSGDSLRLTLGPASSGDGGRTTTLEGVVAGDRAEGDVGRDVEGESGGSLEGEDGETGAEGSGGPSRWSARRVADSDPSPLTWGGDPGEADGAGQDTAGGGPTGPAAPQELR